MNHKLTTATLVTGAVLAAFGNRVQAQVLFSDNFNRADSRNIQASLDGIVNNTGTSLSAGGVYSLPHLDPNNQAPTYGAQDGNAANGGGAQILSSQLRLAVGAGTSDAYINHNFINSSILSAGGFSISLDITAYAQTDYRFGGAFAIGMSASEAASAGDAFDQVSSMTGAFNDLSTLGGSLSGTVVSDFWLALRGNNTLVWGSGAGTVNGVSGLSAKTGTISATFAFTDFNAGSTVNFDVYYNGIHEGNGTFTWSGTDENYIGIDSRDSSGTSFDNLNIAAAPEPSSFALFLLGAAGMLIRRKA